MDETIKELLKSFGHIAREVQIYILSGCIVLLDFAFLDWRYNGFAILYQIGQSTLVLFVLGIVAYVIGNICLGLYYCGRNILCGSWRASNLAAERERLAMELSAFKSDQAAYAYFVERYSLLHNMRGAMSVAFFIATALNVFVLMQRPEVTRCVIGVSASLSLKVAICMFVLARGTEKRMNERIAGLTVRF